MVDNVKDKQLYHFHNSYHIGDCIMGLRFLYNLRYILIEKNMCIVFYYDDHKIGDNKKELLRYCYLNTIILKPLHLKPAISYDTWMGRSVNGIEHTSWSLWHEATYTKILKHLHIDNPTITTSLWQEEDYLNSIYESLPEQYHNIDILIINGKSRSGQYTRDRNELDALSVFLNKTHNIVTTRKVENVNCTLDSDLRLQDIAALSTRVKIIIAVLSGPICALYNTLTKSSVKRWFMLVTNGQQHYIHNDIDYEMITNGSLDSIYNYFNQANFNN